MKKYLSVLLAVVFIISLTGCGSGSTESKIANTKIDIGESEIFTEEDRNSAAEFILDMWKNAKTITELYSITYAGDEESQNETEYYSDTESYRHDEIIVFYIDFHTAKGSAAETFNDDYDYRGWAQMLGRDNGGEWIFVTGGYA